MIAQYTEKFDENVFRKGFHDECISVDECIERLGYNTRLQYFVLGIIA